MTIEKVLESKSMGEIRGTGKRLPTACSNRRCWPNLPLDINIFSHCWVGYRSCSHSTSSVVFFTNFLGNPISWASAKETVIQSSGFWMPSFCSMRSNSLIICCFTATGRLLRRLLLLSFFHCSEGYRSSKSIVSWASVLILEGRPFARASENVTVFQSSGWWRDKA